MNASLLRRLFTAVARSQPSDTRLVCERIVEDERRKGHEKLASELSQLLDKGQPATALTPLPMPVPASRSAAPLVQDIPHERLRHHMVLPAAVEERFHRVEKGNVNGDRPTIKRKSLMTNGRVQ